jgi:hypothetical protein
MTGLNLGDGFITTGSGLYDIAGTVQNPVTAPSMGPTMAAASNLPANTAVNTVATGAAAAAPSYMSPGGWETFGKGLGYGGMALGGLGNLYGAYKGIEILEDQQKMADEAWQREKERQDRLQDLQF